MLNGTTHQFATARNPIPDPVQAANRRHCPRLPSADKAWRCPCWYGPIFADADNRCPCPGGHILPWWNDQHWGRMGTCDQCAHRVWPTWTLHLIPAWLWETACRRVRTRHHGTLWTQPVRRGENNG